MVVVDTDKKEISFKEDTSIKEFIDALVVLSPGVYDYTIKETMVENRFKVVNTYDGYEIKYC